MQHNHTGEKQYTALAIDSRSPVESPLGIPGLSKEMLVKDKTSHVEVKYENASNSSQDQGTSVSTRDNALDFAPTQQKTAVISVLLVDDHALLREGLRQLLELEEDIRIVGEAVDGFDAIQKIRQVRPDVVLMDIRMPMVDGLAVTRQITFEFPSIAVIMLTMYGENLQMLQAIRNGARGYLLKSSSSQEVAQAIRSVQAGG